MADPKVSVGDCRKWAGESQNCGESAIFAVFCKLTSCFAWFCGFCRRHEIPESEANLLYYSCTLKQHEHPTYLHQSLSPSKPHGSDVRQSKWMLLPSGFAPQLRTLSLGNPNVRMDYKPTCLPSALKGDIVCHSGTVGAHLPPALEGDTILQSCLLFKRFWKDDLEQSSCHFCEVQRSKRPMRNCFLWDVYKVPLGSNQALSSAWLLPWLKWGTIAVIQTCFAKVTLAVMLGE